MSRWQAVVFDLDDTLYPERDYVFGGFRAVAAWAAAHLGIPPDQGFAELKRLYEQGVRGDTFDRWLATYSLSQDGLVPQLVQVYREHQPVLRPFPEAPGVLTALRQRYRLGLLSDGYLAVQQRKLTALGLTKYLDAIVFSDEWGREAWKPSLRPFEAVVERLGVEVAWTVYVADNPLKDFLGARQVGMATIRLRWPEGEYAHLSPPTARHAPDRVIESLSQLEQTLVDLEAERRACKVRAPMTR